jgi:hypothetical protein
MLLSPYPKTKSSSKVFIFGISPFYQSFIVQLNFLFLRGKNGMHILIKNTLNIRCAEKTTKDYIMSKNNKNING